MGYVSFWYLCRIPDTILLRLALWLELMFNIRWNSIGRAAVALLKINNNAANLQVRKVFNVLEFTFWFSITLCLLKYQLLARKQLFLKDDKLFTITHIYNSLRDRNLLEGTIPSSDRELASYIMSDSTKSGRHAVFKHIALYFF